MKTKPRNERILRMAAGFLLLSILMMAAVIPGILNDTAPGSRPGSATTAILIAMGIHLLIFAGYLIMIRDTRRIRRKRRPEYIGIGLALLFFGLIYSDGAVAFMDHKSILYVSVLMFASVLFDMTASIMTIILFFFKPQITQ